MKTKIDFIGIGVGKAGTTTVARLLEAHPQICLSIPKEVRYFNKFAPYKFAEKPNPNYDKSIDWYMNHFNHCQVNSIKGEFTPSYFLDAYAPKTIHNTFPNAKLIVCLRNPSDRIYSHYQMVKNFHLDEMRTFSEVIRSESKYIQKWLYHENLSRFLTYFDKSQLMVLRFEEIKDRPLATIQKLYRFLGVDDAFVPSNIYLKANGSKKTKLKWLNQLESKAVKIIGGMGGGKLIQWLKKKNFHHWLHHFNTRSYKYPPMSEEDRNWLKQQFHEDIEKLEELLQMDFSDWK